MLTLKPDGLLTGTYTDASGKTADFTNNPIDLYGPTAPADFAAIAGIYSATGTGNAGTFIDNTGTHTIGGPGTMAITIASDGTVSYAINGATPSVLTWDGNGNYLKRTSATGYLLERGGDGSQANTIFMSVDLSGTKAIPCGRCG